MCIELTVDILGDMELAVITKQTITDLRGKFELLLLAHFSVIDVLALNNYDLQPEC